MPLHTSLTHAAAPCSRLLPQIGAAVDAAETAQLFALADVACSGAIEYEAFLAAMLDSARLGARRGALRTSFERLDRDGDGFISVTDLAQVRLCGAARPGQSFDGLLLGAFAWRAPVLRVCEWRGCDCAAGSWDSSALDSCAASLAWQLRTRSPAGPGRSRQAARCRSALQVLAEGAPLRRGPAARKASLDLAASMVAEADADRDGTVSYDDFRRMWQPQHGCRDARMTTRRDACAG